MTFSFWTKPYTFVKARDLFGPLPVFPSCPLHTICKRLHDFVLPSAQYKSGNMDTTPLFVPVNPLKHSFYYYKTVTTTMGADYRSSVEKLLPDGTNWVSY
jgi:hypothetical protein